jgi:alanine racemase
MLKFATRRARRSLCVSIGDRRAPVLGRVAMQMMVVDVTALEDVEVGTEVIVPAMRIPTNPLIPRICLQA